MTGELKAGAVVEIQVGKCVFVGMIIDTDAAGVQLDMDGRLRTGTQVSLYEPSMDRAVSGNVSDCAPIEAGGFRLHVTTPGRSAGADQPFVWPPGALKYARM